MALVAATDRRVVSSACFRVLSLQLETQNDVDVLKPILEELEVLRLGCALGALSAVNPTDLEHGFCEPKQFDAEFTRFLRSDVVDDTTDLQVRVLGLFGKQAQVAHELKRLGGWDSDMEDKLVASDLGMYAVVLPHQHSQNAEGTKTVVVFPWLMDEQFHPDQLRETPTYLARLLTCLTSHVTCCVSQEDKQLLEAPMTSSGVMGTGVAQPWRSFSVAFRVDQQQDRSDGVEASVVRQLPLPHMAAPPKKVFVVKGSFPALAAISDVPSEKATRRWMESFDTADQFCEWLSGRLESYAVDVSPSQWPVLVKQSVLRKFGKWPQTELQGIETRFNEAARTAERECEDAILRLWGECSATLFMAGEHAFRVESVIANQRTNDAIREIECSILQIVGDPTFGISEDYQNILLLPLRLPLLLSICLELFYNGEERRLNELLSRAHCMTKNDLCQERVPMGFLINLRSWLYWMLSIRHSIPGPFRERIQVPLETMKQLWWVELSNVLEDYVSHSRKLQVSKRMSELKQAYEAEMSILVDNAIEKLSGTWASNETNKLLLQCTVYNGSNLKLNCAIVEEYYLRPREQLQLWKLKDTTSATTGINSSNLGKLDLDDGEVIVGCFCVQTKSIFKVSTTNEQAKVDKVEFPASTAGWKKSSPSIQRVRQLKRMVNICDLNVADRMLVLGDTAGSFRIFRVNETYTSIEVMRTFDAAVKTSLTMPVADVLLSDGILYMVDHTGSVQSLNTRNQQISRKQDSRSEADLQWNNSLFVLADGSTLGWCSIDNGSISLRLLATDDLRELPLSKRPLLEFEIPDPSSYAAFEDSVFIVNKADGVTTEIAVEVTLKSESYRIRTVGGAHKHRDTNLSTNDGEQPFADHWMLVFYHLFEKFPVVGELERDRSNASSLRLDVVCEVDNGVVCADLEQGFRNLLVGIRERLELLNKPLYGMDFTGGDSRQFGVNVTENLAAKNEATPRNVGSLLRALTTFVPVQICRAQSDNLLLMTDGLIPPSDQLGNSDSVQAADIARSLRFGLLSPLLASWDRQCIVITSMGKQSTGKSYFLNHLAGSSFAISGARCTDGAWMSVCFLSNDILLVVIDFEGLGSLERTEQEDVFLSVLNASVSMLTIFRMEMRLDKEIDELFSKFQKGSQLIKSDPQLFRGKLYMSVKDVNPNDQRGVVSEFVVKFQRLLAANKEQNFLTDMYAGQVDINCSPPLGTVGYYQSLSQAQRYVASELCANPKAGFPTGKAFLDCIRLLLAKISNLDWTSMDDSAIKFKIAESLRKLPGVVRYGCLVFTAANAADNARGDPSLAARDELLSETDGSRIQVSFDETCDAHPTMAGSWRHTRSFIDLDSLDDEDIDLCSSFSVANVNQSVAASRAIGLLFATFLKMRRARDAKRVIVKRSLQMQFDAFLNFVVRRRCLRVQKWCRSIFPQRIPERWSAAEHHALGCAQSLIVRCLDSCSTCQLGCMKASVHSSSGDLIHDCATDHACAGRCAYCADMAVEGKTPRCSKVGGHEGRCECGSGDHTCRQPCLLERASNCGKECARKAGHDDADSHRCAVGLHKCGSPCAAANCVRLCVLDVEVLHTAHKCEVDRCLARCVVDGCNRACHSLDHFHGQTEAKVAFGAENPDLVGKHGDTFDGSSDVPVIHICDSAHPCPEMCGQDGICHIDVLLKKSFKTFVGARDTFQYTYQEMNGSRKRCAHMLEPGKLTHGGIHTCIPAEIKELGHEDDETKSVGQGDSVQHYCDTRCQCCSYYCQREFGHTGLHKTTHGNMKNTVFVSDDSDIDLLDRKYTAGERGTAEMCNLYCSKMGRGHVHFLNCEKTCAFSGSTEDMRRHCTRGLEPKPEQEQDELLHARFWETLGWEDPCSSVQEREEFAKCGYHCDAPDHDDKPRSYCILDAWHLPAPRPTTGNDGYSYLDGHKFECSHSTADHKMHHIFVLDASGSMAGRPWEQLIGAFREFVHNRVDMGATEDVVSVVTFSCYASIIYEAVPIASILGADVRYTNGGTSFSAALRSANEVLSRVMFSEYKPVVIFFSDGNPTDGVQGERLARHIFQTYAKYDLAAFVVGFGSLNLGLLKRVADLLGGSYCKVLTGDELKTTFQSISASLGTRAGLALTSPTQESCCVICQKELANETKTMLTPCHHEIHERCFRRLVEVTPRGIALLCPTCRREIHVK